MFPWLKPYEATETNSKVDSESTTSETPETPSLFSKPGVYLISGRSGSGKTTLVKRALNKMKIQPYSILLLSPSSKFQDSDYNNLPKAMKFHDNLKEVFDKAMRKQGELMKQYDDNKEGQNCPYLMVILDDCANQMGINSKESTLASISTYCRKMNTFIVILQQQACLVNITTRENATHVVLTPFTGIIDNLKDMIKEDEKILFQDAVDHCKKPYSFFVFDPIGQPSIWKGTIKGSI